MEVLTPFSGTNHRMEILSLLAIIISLKHWPCMNHGWQTTMPYPQSENDMKETLEFTSSFGSPSSFLPSFTFPTFQLPLLQLQRKRKKREKSPPCRSFSDNILTDGCMVCCLSCHNARPSCYSYVSDLMENEGSCEGNWVEHEGVVVEITLTVTFCGHIDRAFG